MLQSMYNLYLYVHVDYMHVNVDFVPFEIYKYFLWTL